MHTQVATLVTDDRHTAQAVLVACICTHRLVWSPDTLYGAIHDAPIMPHEFGWEASVPLEEISANAAVTINTPVRCDCDKHVCAAILTHKVFLLLFALSPLGAGMKFATFGEFSKRKCRHVARVPMRLAAAVCAIGFVWSRARGCKL